MKKCLFISLCFLGCQITVAAGDELVVLNRVAVETGREDVASGLVYSTLPGQQVETQEEKSDKLESVYDLFELALAELNEKLKRRIGFVPFTGSKYLGKGSIEITATSDWLALPRGQREAQLSEVFAIWAAALGEGRSITIFVVDKDGARPMSMLR